MEKTLQQKLVSKERYLVQNDKAIHKLLFAKNIYDYIDGLKYAYSFCKRYNKNFKGYVLCYCSNQVHQWEKCLKAGILKEWNDTYYFDKEKAESLQQYIWEHSTN